MSDYDTFQRITEAINSTDSEVVLKSALESVFQALHRENPVAANNHLAIFENLINSQRHGESFGAFLKQLTGVET